MFNGCLSQTILSGRGKKIGMFTHTCTVSQGRAALLDEIKKEKSSGKPSSSCCGAITITRKDFIFMGEVFTKALKFGVSGQNPANPQSVF